MSNLAERLRKENRDRLHRMSPADRVAEAWALGDAAIATYAAAHGVDREQA